MFANVLKVFDKTFNMDLPDDKAERLIKFLANAKPTSEQELISKIERYISINFWCVYINCHDFVGLMEGISSHCEKTIKLHGQALEPDDSIALDYVHYFHAAIQHDLTDWITTFNILND
jgi:hypothetical protein